MNTTPAWGMAASLLRTSLSRPRCLVQIRPHVLIEGTHCKYSPGWITHIHTTSPWPKDLEAIKKAVLEVSAYPGRMPKREERKVLEQLNPDEKRAARKRIKLAARKKRKELKVAQLLGLDTAGQTDLNPPPKSAEKKPKKAKGKGKKMSKSDRPNTDVQRSSSTHTPDPVAELDSLPDNAPRGPLQPDRTSQGNDYGIIFAAMLNSRWEDPKGKPQGQDASTDTDHLKKPHLPAKPTSSASTARTRSTPDHGQRPRKTAPNLKSKLKHLSRNRKVSDTENPSDTAAKG